jgi:hypothetical protein
MRRMVLMVPVVLGALTACSNPFSTSSGEPSAPLGTPTAPSTSASISPTVAPGTDDQQTGEPNPSPYVTPSRTVKPGAKPACSAVWVDMNVLPADYDGCTGGNPAVDETSLECNDGSTLWMRNQPSGDEYYAFTSKAINHTKDPDGDAAAQAKCMS